MKNKKDEIIKYSFTKYVDVAIMRARKDYINKEKKRSDVEEVADIDVFLRKEGWMDEKISDNLMVFDARAIKNHLSRLVGMRMLRCLECLTARELQIVYLKVFHGYTFIEIGEVLMMDWKKVASVYSYARKKMQKGWKRYDV